MCGFLFSLYRHGTFQDNQEALKMYICWMIKVICQRYHGNGKYFEQVKTLFDISIMLNMRETLVYYSTCWKSKWLTMSCKCCTTSCQSLTLLTSRLSYFSLFIQWKVFTFLEVQIWELEWSYWIPIRNQHHSGNWNIIIVTRGSHWGRRVRHSWYDNEDRRPTSSKVCYAGCTFSPREPKTRWER